MVFIQHTAFDKFVEGNLGFSVPTRENKWSKWSSPAWRFTLVIFPFSAAFYLRDGCQGHGVSFFSSVRPRWRPRYDPQSQSTVSYLQIISLASLLGEKVTSVVSVTGISSEENNCCFAFSVKIHNLIFYTSLISVILFALLAY